MKISLVFVGHIDHGKSTLIGRLLYDTNSLPEDKIKEIKETCKALGKEMEFAYITDALEEERKNNITIDTTQIFFKSKRDYMIVDTPGHKEFLKNMVTGASYADLGVLIVDAEEGIGEQTKRHAYILKILGIEKIIVVVNKMDKVNYSKKRFLEIKEILERYLNSVGLIATYVPVSAYYGDNVVKRNSNMSWYKGNTFLELLDKIEIKRKKFDFRFAIQDIYKGIYLGNIISGEIKEGEEVKIYPSNKTAKIKEIIYGNKKLKGAKAPLCVGLVFDKEINAKRGEIICKSKPKIKREIDAMVMCLVEEIKEGEKYKFLCATQEVEGVIKKVIEKINVETLEREYDDKLKENEIGKVKIYFEKSIVMEDFNLLPELGRFAIAKQGKLIAGGRL